MKGQTLRKRVSCLLLWFCLAGLPSWVAACSIVHGANWAFMSKPPSGWSSVCGSQAVAGTVITLWPEGTTLAKTDALIYVTVSDPHPQGLKAFAQEEQAKFLQSTPGSEVRAVEDAAAAGDAGRILVRFKNSGGNREELLAYVEGPGGYYMVILSAASGAAFEAHRAAFLEYLGGFLPMAKG